MKKIISIIAILAQCWFMPAWAQNMLTLPNVKVPAGFEFDYEIGLENTDEITAIQFDVFIPGMLECASVNPFILSERTDSSHKLEMNGNRVIVYSDKNEPFIGNKGTIIKLRVTPQSINEVSFLIFSDIILVKPDGTTIRQNRAEGNITTGGPNGDANITIALPVLDATSGETLPCPVTICNNDTKLTAFQLDVYTNTNELIIEPELPASLDSTHVLEFNTVAEGSYRILIYSLRNKPVPTGEHTLMNLNLTASPKMRLGSYPLWMGGNLVKADGSETSDYTFEPGVIRITDEGDYIPVENVELLPTSLYLTAGETYQLIYHIYPENATDQRIYWYSNSPDIAEVDTTGLIIARKKGKALIYARCMDNNSEAYCYVNVSNGTSINNTGEAAIPYLYPTPAKNVLNIAGLQPDDVVTMNTVSGATVFQSRADAATIIWEIAELPKGVYLIQVLRGNGKTVIKFIK